MTVVSEGPLCLKIHLSKYEIKKYFNGYNRINTKNPTSIKTINMLFKIALNHSEFETGGKRLIEVFPTSSGGCILKFTSDPLPFQIQKHDYDKNSIYKKIKAQNKPYIFCFKSLENLLSLIEVLCKTKNIENYCSTLFKKGNKIFLKIYIPLSDIRTGIIISEFSEYSTKGIIAECALIEYANQIIENNAIEVLEKYFLKKL